jgi:hypothetical protein
MKRRQILTLWPALAGARDLRPADRRLIGKQSTRSEVSEYASPDRPLCLGGLAPESHPDERENGEQTEKR